eukprot:CAMPEP_0172517820 /NCGR_PEP_ID=MMETSP1066-20121228/288204_1 /TAXON_ID=671091 /ORGANISM="Coscinodiscus wailesii, Strain CCMP2513" /LENGTH=84 /DNA_ID=CAMNT_0013299999 /DNA_START=7 /DNA_END=258 /DNA_ORIENTATION=+
MTEAYECTLMRDYKTTPKIDATQFQVSQSAIGERAGRGVFTKVDVTKGSVIGREAAHLAIHFSAVTHEILYFLYMEYDGMETKA